MAEDRSFDWVRERYGPTLDCGSGVLLRWSTRDGNVLGAIRDHLRPDTGAPCSSTVFFDVTAVDPFRRDGKAIHTLVSWEPFTLAPSLLCRSCGSHGFVQAGRWVPA